MSSPMTTTATHAGFIADICEHPDDDSIRLIYADWLEDHGDPERASLIRWMLERSEVQAKFWHNPESSSSYLICGTEGHSLEGNPYRPRYEGEKTGSWACSMRIAMVGTDDVPGEPPFGIAEEFHVIFRRGFLAEVHAPLSVLEKHLPALVRQHPIERVRATDREPLNLHNRPVSRHRWAREFDGIVVGITPNEPMYLPKGVWRYMPRDMDGGNPSDSLGLDYATADAAHAALSEVMLRLAKER